jgi:hypothetical protein
VLRCLTKRRRNVTISVRCKTLEALAPLLHRRGSARSRTRRHPPDDVGQNPGGLVVASVHGHAGERVARFQALEQHRPITMLKDAHDALSIESTQHVA